MRVRLVLTNMAFYQFLVRGVVYRLHGKDAEDPLVDDRLEDLERDICLFKELRLNVLFVGTYSIPWYPA